ncbi:MAG TPA: adenylate/guanylate cyclase domain-containing protein [bacterium]|nr:adenylate/guanylate cyclase domain-containing protein [bacterium]HPP29593.1 adenylate/guanylate cyclase domain-containing protein [bacterium]
MLRRNKNLLLVVFVVNLLLFFLFKIDFFRRLENTTYDWRMKFLQDKQPTGDIVIVFIGDDTLSLLGEWPISRQWYAGITQILKDMGAKAVVFDILFIERKEGDKEFAKAIKEAGNVILPFFFDHPEVKKGILEAEKMVEPVEELKSGALSTGFINILPDSDGVIRRYPLFIDYNGKTYSSLDVSVIENILCGSIISMGKDSVEFEIGGDKRKIPVNEDRTVYLNIYNDLKKFPNYSFVQVFQSYMKMAKGEQSVVPVDAFKDKIVLIGITATGVPDTGNVAGIAGYPLAGVHASFLENFLKGEFIEKAGDIHNFLIPLCFSFFSGAIAVAFSPVISVISVVLVVCLFTALAFSLFTFKLLWIDILYPVSSIILVYGLIVLVEFIYEEKEKARIRNMFGRYISTQVMEKILALKDEIMLAGEKKTITVLFADIRGFTSYTDRHSPEETFSFLNRVLSIMAEAIFKFGGTLDKFIGDEVMGIYGAPVDDPNHALNAALSAIEMVKKVEEFSKDVKIGIGINTGDAIIGNIGTAQRMEYTAIGDVVNVAARIEELTSGGEIFTGEETYNLIKKEILCEPAGVFTIRGKQDKLTLYRVIGKESGGDEDEKEN